MRIKSFKKWYSAGSLFLFFALSLFAQDDLVTAEGEGTGVNPAEALMAAKRNAVEKGIGTVLLSQTEIENFMVSRDQVITKTMGTVKSYEKLDETKASDGLYTVRIKAVLSRSSMREDLAAFHILIESMNKPRVMVVIKENNVGNQEPTNQSAENAIIQFLKTPYEFDLVDPQVSATIRSSDEKMAALSGNASAASAMATQYGAEVLITGTAVSREATETSANLGGMKSVQADVTLTAINCTTGRIINSSDAHSAMVHVSANSAGVNAIAKASKKAMEKLLDAIIKEWQGQVNNGVPLVITMTQVTTYRAKTNVIQTLSAISGVSSVKERSWDGVTKTLLIDVVYKGNADGFCNRIDGYKLGEGGGSIGVSGLNGTRVTLVLQVM